ncbi:MAG: DUF5309 domain-containing protein [Pseudomonadota bacterium]|nr:DUF5309 domain-containing protein [Pseudomonadota bacterium]
MAAPTNLETTVNSVGQRESLDDVIHRVVPEETPFYSLIRKGKAKARLEEWQTETLRSPNADNAALEGNDVGTLDAPNRTTRVGVYCQIFDETGGVSRTQEKVDLAGRKSEMARQKALKGIEVRRDIEARIIGNYASQNESGSNPRKTAGMLSWIETNDDRGVGGSAGGWNTGGVVDAASNGTQRTFTEAQVKSIMAAAFNNGAKPTVCFVSAAHKQAFSAFTGIADIRRDVKGQEQAVIHAAADVYVSDFGAVQIVPHPYGLTRDALFVTPGMVEWRVLDGWKTKALAKTGDSERFLMTHEGCLAVLNEKAHGVIADLS